jgi:hypothetical protein
MNRHRCVHSVTDGPTISAAGIAASDSCGKKRQRRTQMEKI